MAASKVSQTLTERNLILIGKTGNGKSATGNTILGQTQAFIDSGDTSSVTQTVAMKSCLVNGRIVRVVDTPGLFDTYKTRERWEIDASEHLSTAFKKCPRGFDALVLVLKYGNRFTDEEENVVSIFKKYLGDHFLRDHCVMIFTHGEDLELQKICNESLTFEKWRFQQRGYLSKFMGECQNRVVLFSNMTPGNEEPLKKFFKMVDDIGKCYTYSMFREKQIERERHLVRESVLQLRDAFEKKVYFLKAKFNHIRETDMDNSDELLSELDVLERDTRSLEQEINEADKGTNILSTLSQFNKELLDSIVRYRTILRLQKQAMRDALHNLNERLEAAHVILALSIFERELQRSINAECAIQ